MKNLKLMLILTIFTLNSNLFSQNIFQPVKTIEVHLDSAFKANYYSIINFSYDKGQFWTVTNRGYLAKLDTSGNFIGAIKINQSSFYRLNNALFFDSDTIWIAGDNDFGGKLPQNGIMAIDTSGNELGIVIPLPNFSRTVSPISSLIKDGNTFWVYDYNGSIIFQMNRSGVVLRQFPHAWYGVHSPNVALIGNKIYKIGDGRSQHDTWYNVMGLDIETGWITDDWGWGCENQSPLGLSAGDDCLWSFQSEYEGTGFKVTIHKFEIPSTSPIPDLATYSWGDFRIVDWAYCPISPPSIEGLHGFGYDKTNHTFWFGYGHSRFMSSDGNNSKILPIIRNWKGSDIINFADYWTNDFKIYYDIHAHNDSIWVSHRWRGLYTGRATLFKLNSDSLFILRDWDAMLDHVSGIASDGDHVFISGRVIANTTADRNNDIKKYTSDDSWLYISSILMMMNMILSI